MHGQSRAATGSDHVDAAASVIRTLQYFNDTVGSPNVTGTKVAALFVDKRGPYWGRDDIDAWDVERDARLYAGPHPVVAHPPCFLWVNLAAVNWKRYQREKPAWYPGGTDGGCFASALAAIRKHGGVLEHPAFSHAWAEYGLLRPASEGWLQSARVDDRGWSEWACEVWQSAYGHKARKRTWLYYAGNSPPPELDWRREPGTAQVGWFDRIKPTLSKLEAIKSPPSFAEMLVELARGSRC